MAVQALKERGVCVIPVYSSRSELQCAGSAFMFTLMTLPELRAGAQTPSLGGFGALGLPSSFHHFAVRCFRARAYNAAAPFFRQFLNSLDMPLDTWKLEQLVDRVQWRAPGTKTTAESFHRDLTVYGPGSSAQEGDHFFGGWLNFDPYPQYFSCVPGTQKPGENSGAGFSPLSPAQVGEYKDKKELIEVPPGHLIIFYSNIIHEVVPRKRDYPSVRMYCGWRLTTQSRTLFDDFLKRMREQSAMQLPSRQEPPMHSSMHWMRWPDELQAWSLKNIADEYLVTRTVQSGKRQGEVFRVVPRYLRNTGRHFADYKEEELQIHRPHSLEILVGARGGVDISDTEGDETDSEVDEPATKRICA
jgi:hypothetical protein